MSFANIERLLKSAGFTPQMHGNDDKTTVYALDLDIPGECFVVIDLLDGSVSFQLVDDAGRGIELTAREFTTI